MKYPNFMIKSIFFNHPILWKSKNQNIEKYWKIILNFIQYSKSDGPGSQGPFLENTTPNLLNIYKYLFCTIPVSEHTKFSISY